MEDFCWALLGADVSTEHQALSFERVGGSVIAEKRHEILSNECSSTSWARFHQLTVVMSLAVECGVIGSALKKSEILYRDAGERVYAARSKGEVNMVGYCHRLLLHEDLNSVGCHFKTYAESKMNATTEAFLKFTNRLLETATDRNMVQDLVHIVLTRSFAMRCVNDGMRLSGDEELEGRKFEKGEKHNFEF